METRQQEHSKAFSILRIAVGLFIVLYPINNWTALFRGTIDPSALAVTYLMTTLIVGIWLMALGVLGVRKSKGTGHIRWADGGQLVRNPSIWLSDWVAPSSAPISMTFSSASTVS